MKTWKLYIVSFLLIAFVGFLYGFAGIKNNQTKIDKITVNFVETQPAFITAEKVNKLLIQSDSKLLNKAKSLINLHQIEQVVRKNQMIENAELFLTLDDELKVNITQRVPVARFQNGMESYYIDRKGDRMPLSPNYTARVPLVLGAFNDEKEKEIYNLIQLINRDPFYKKQIIGYQLLENGDYLLSTRVGRHKILFGKTDNAEDKLKKLKVFYKKKWDSELMKRYKLINLKYSRQVVCTK
jgi:cell division protein FtsQ